MSILCRQVSLAELSTCTRAYRQSWQSGVEVAVITYRKGVLGFIVPLEIFASVPTEVIAGMPLKDLQPWLFQNQQGWIEGIMDGLTLTWQKRDVLGFVHPRYAKQLPLPLMDSDRLIGIKLEEAKTNRASRFT